MTNKAVPGACVGNIPTVADGAQVPAPNEVAVAARALFSLGRTFSRQSVREQLRERSDRAVDLSRVLVVQAVDESLDREDGEVTIGTVAERLGIDPSTASRLVADATRDGYLTRSASSRDGRRACLTLTDAGRSLVEASQQFQRQMFLEATASWAEEERDQFARLFVRFADAVARQCAEVTRQTPGSAGERDAGGAPKRA